MLITQAKVWETMCDATVPLMIFIPQGIGQKRFPAEQLLPRTQDRERGAIEEKEATRVCDRERNSKPHSLRQSAGQRGGDSEKEPTAYLVW